MSYEYFKYETREIEINEGHSEKLGLLTIDSPPMNALSAKVLTEMDKVIDDVQASGARVVILTGAGKAFVAGADISDMKNLEPGVVADFSRLGQRIFTKIERSDFISIAAVNGFALGGGLELALSCDFRIFSDKAQVGLPEVTLGLIPGFGGTQRLTREIGKGNANYLVLTGERIRAEESLRLGICQKIFPIDELMTGCEAIAKKILKNGPLSVNKAKHLVDYAATDSLDTGLEKEAQDFAYLFTTPEPREGLSAFLEKRPPRFS